MKWPPPLPRRRDSSRGSDYEAAVADAPVLSRVLAGVDVLEWTTVTLVSDDPAKGLGQAEDANLLIGQLPALIGRPERSVDLVSAYLIPGEIGTSLVEGYLADGIRTRLVTNSLEANDVPVVHSAWMGYRERLLRAGAEILELRARPDQPEGASLLQLLTGSQSSLHAKTFAIDGERIFIGSFNFDPRSAMLNTEMGFLIDSPAIATALSRALDGRETFYVVTAEPDGSITWTEGRGRRGRRRCSTASRIRPRSSAGMVTFMSWLPVEWIL